MIEEAGFSIVLVRNCEPRITPYSRYYYLGVTRRSEPPPDWLVACAAKTNGRQFCFACPSAPTISAARTPAAGQHAAGCALTALEARCAAASCFRMDTRNGTLSAFLRKQSNAVTRVGSLIPKTSYTLRSTPRGHATAGQRAMACRPLPGTCQGRSSSSDQSRKALNDGPAQGAILPDGRVPMRGVARR
jgi:hypothetical protein